ncbi:lycopene cyclase [Streptomyces fagopyri]|uniref:Lycopene cyclase n=1 Tax=Streptomyces fagopyri TaxID=2662397 RepID=A0A5Q0LNH0_9ACTN|nr:FAD/NAD(P)-binding protein [Streptomyces fagopyri]QFZ78059.1 lycopene cyclase [Streptomyces fagopyri]
MSWISKKRRVAVVGAGAAGTLTAARLLKTAAARRLPLEVVLVDPCAEAGRGVAYRTEDPRHVLNVPAGRMSADPDDPDHFTRWLAERGWPEDASTEFVPRAQFGAYLAHVLAAAATCPGPARLRRRAARAVGIRRGGPALQLDLGPDGILTADAVVLATGNPPPSQAWAPAGLRGAEAFVPDPWAPGALDSLPVDDDILLVGTGLTMVDMALTLARPGRVVRAVSRHGLLPRVHTSTPASIPAPRLEPKQGYAALRRDVLVHLARCRRESGDWRVGVDSLRPITAQLWQRLDPADQARFLTEDQRLWEVHRHRIPPRSAKILQQLLDAGQMTADAGEVAAATSEGRRLRVMLTDGRTLRVGAVLNCTSTPLRPSDSDDPLITELLASGLAVPGPHGIGFATDDEGRLLTGATGSPPPLWTLGSPRRGTLLESTAVPEIRGQAKAVARAVVDGLYPARNRRQSRQSDLYGLPLTTSAEAARLYNQGLERILQGGTGAPELLANAVQVDPGFGVAHAAQALLGHECGADINVAASLRSAQAAARDRGGDRERSLVAAVTALIAAPPETGSRAVLRHIAAFPRDALVVSVAIPTISFNGVTSAEQTWQLVDDLRTHYGDDWWFTGQAAFVRQEQGRWLEAEELATRALAAQPAAGHAVHALAHVHYETGHHEHGRAWIDAWLRRHGSRSAYRAHFSWHAGLHELMLDDREAVNRRYHEQLAPSRVTGSRLLVDSASLLWRCAVTGRWDGPLPLQAVLAAAPSEWLDRPPTPFAAMHSAIALAAGADPGGLDRLRRQATAHSSPVFREVIAPLCEALEAMAQQRWRTSITLLRGLLPHLAVLGGSAAQHEVVEEMLIRALLEDNRGFEAARILEARLDRRPSPLDRSRLMDALRPRSLAATVASV